MVKVIQVRVDEKLLNALNAASKAQRVSRAEFVRQACRSCLKLKQEAEWDRQYAEGYRRIPEDPAIGEVGAKLASEVLEREDW